MASVWAIHRSEAPVQSFVLEEFVVLNETLFVLASLFGLEIKRNQNLSV